jgi:hypothetical protein
MPAGRPSKVTPTLVKKANEYLATYKELGKNIPTVEGLAEFVALSRETLYARPEFSDTLGKIAEKQREDLQQNGLTGKFNPHFTKFLLSANHGMMEKSAVENSGEQKLVIETVSYADDKDSAAV